MLRQNLGFRVVGGIACFLAAFAAVQAQATLSSRPQGVIKTTFSAGVNALSLPLLGDEIFLGVVGSCSANTVIFTGSNPAERLEAGKKYYLEVETGSLEGERFDIDAAASAGASLALDLSAASFSTSSSIAPGALNGARVALREHITLSTLTTLFTPALVGHNSAARADGVLLWVNGALRTYYLRADGTTWRESGKAVNESQRVIPPDTSLVLVLNSGRREWEHMGGVRTNAFRVKLTAGTRAFATGFPVDLSPVQIGAFVDDNVPAGQRWVGSDAPGLADMLHVFEQGAFVPYHLRADGVRWRRVGHDADVQNSPLLRAMGAVTLKRNNPDLDALIVRPY